VGRDRLQPVRSAGVGERVGEAVTEITPPEGVQLYPADVVTITVAPRWPRGLSWLPTAWLPVGKLEVWADLEGKLHVTEQL
jgi:hypothetical protein